MAIVRMGDPNPDPPSAIRSAVANFHSTAALDFWYSRINYEQRSAKPSDLKLDRMHALLERLGNPHHDLRIVHMAGSKGKGSTSAMIAEILTRAGYRTGLFTSPHLCRVEERIQIDRQPIPDEELTALLGEIQCVVQAMDRDGTPDVAGVTFFEVATALGFLYFARKRVAAAVIEVGLGGRFDSTNVCSPLLSVITSISFDHTQQLGNRLGQIAMEKAGIVKPGRPTLSGARDVEARAVIEQICRERGSSLLQIDRDLHYRHHPGHISQTQTILPRVQVRTERNVWPEMQLGLLGEHQAANATLAVAAIAYLRDAGFHIDNAAVQAGLAEVRWPARLEVVGYRPLVVLDCAHNVASAQAMVDTLAESFPGSDRSAGKSSRRLLILACSNDKDLPGMLGILAPHFDHFYLTRFHDNPRSVPPEVMAAELAKIGDIPASLYCNAETAWHAARQSARPEDLICVTGSVFLAGELRPKLVSRPSSVVLSSLL